MTREELKREVRKRIRDHVTDVVGQLAKELHASMTEAAIIFRGWLEENFDMFYEASPPLVPDPDGKHRQLVREIITEALDDFIRHSAN